MHQVLLWKRSFEFFLTHFEHGLVKYLLITLFLQQLQFHRSLLLQVRKLPIQNVHHFRISKKFLLITYILQAVNQLQYRYLFKPFSIYRLSKIFFQLFFLFALIFLSIHGLLAFFQGIVFQAFEKPIRNNVLVARFSK